MKELTYNNSRRSMIPKEYHKSSRFAEKHLSLLASCLASLGAFCIGSCIGWSSDAILSSGTFPLTFEDMTSTEISWVVATFAIGAAISTFSVYRLWHIVGTKIFVLISSGFLITSWVLLAVHENLVTILCARLLAGLAAGALSFLVPVYIEDITKPDSRTTIDLIWNFQLVFGIFVQFILGTFGSMKQINIASGIAPFMLLPIFACLPESPRYLCMKGQTNAAKEILTKFRALDDETEQEIQLWSSKKLNLLAFRALFKSTASFRRFLPTIGIILFDQLTGIWPALFYISWIFQITGGNLEPKYAALVVSSIFLISTVLLKFLRVKISDKRLLIWSGVLMSMSLIASGYYMHVKGSTSSTSTEYAFIPLVCFGCYVFFYGIGLGRLSWKYTRTLMPKSSYFAARGFCTTAHWLLLIIFSRAYPGLVETVGVGWIFWFMAASSVAMSVFTAFLIPELGDSRTKYILNEGDDNAVEQQSEIQL